MSDRRPRGSGEGDRGPGVPDEAAPAPPPAGADAPSDADSPPAGPPRPRAGTGVDARHVAIPTARAAGTHRPPGSGGGPEAARPARVEGARRVPVDASAASADRAAGTAASAAVAPASGRATDLAGSAPPSDVPVGAAAAAPAPVGPPSWDGADQLDASSVAASSAAAPHAAPGPVAAPVLRAAASVSPRPRGGSPALLLPDVAAWPGVAAVRGGLAVAFRPGELRDAVMPTLLIRIGVFVFAAIGITTFGDAGARAQQLGAMWNHWDGPHFLEIAARGYDPTGDPARAVLFPLYPALIYVGSFVLEPLAVAMAITLVSTLVAALGLYRLVRPDGRALARGSVLALSLFPVAYFLIAPYSEAPFLAFTVWAFVAARDDRWAVAGTLGMLAALTRLQGAFLLPALAVEYAVRRRRAGLPIVGVPATWIGLVALGPLVFLAMNAYAYGDPFFFLSMQTKIFHVETIAPWDALPVLWGNVTSHPGGESWTTVYLAPFVSFVILGIVAVWTLVSRRSTAGYATYTWLTLASLATLSWPISVPRYLIDVFPIYIAGAQVGRRRDVGVALGATSAMLLGAFTILYVEGHWAF